MGLLFWSSIWKNHWFLLSLSAAAKSLQSCPTLCDPMDGSPPGSPVPGILQARTLEWVAISFSNAWKWKVKGKSLSRVRLFATPWTTAYQAPLSVGFSRQEYWSGVPPPSPSSFPTHHEKKIKGREGKQVTHPRRMWWARVLESQGPGFQPQGLELPVPWLPLPEQLILTPWASVSSPTLRLKQGNALKAFSKVLASSQLLNSQKKGGNSNSHGTSCQDGCG